MQNSLEEFRRVVERAFLGHLVVGRGVYDSIIFFFLIYKHISIYQSMPKAGASYATQNGGLLRLRQLF